MFGADITQDFGLLFLADDVHQRHAILDTDLVQHLAEIGCSGRMHEGFMTHFAHGLDERQCRKRIHIAGGALLCRSTFRQLHDLGGIQHAVFGVEFTTKARNALAEQGLRRFGLACGDNRTGTFISNTK